MLLKRFKLGKLSIRSMENLWNKMFEFCMGANHTQCSFNFINKIQGSSSTAHCSTTKYFLSCLALYNSYGRRWNVKSLSCQKKSLLHQIYVFHSPLHQEWVFGFSILRFWLGLQLLFHEQRLESSVLDLSLILFLKLELHYAR